MGNSVPRSLRRDDDTSNIINIHPSINHNQYITHIQHTNHKDTEFDLDHYSKQIYLVSGFIHTQEIKLKIHSIPMDIIQLLLTFYVIKDEWDNKICQREEIDLNKYTITNKSCNGRYKNIYLRHTTDENRGIYHWTFKMINIPSDKQYIIIGITSDNTPKQFYNVFDGTMFNGYSYGYNVGGGYLQSTLIDSGRKYSYQASWRSSLYYDNNNSDGYGIQCGNNDIIDMYLNMNNKTLSYDINKISYGIAYEDITPNKYKGVVSMYWWDESIELVSFFNSYK